MTARNKDQKTTLGLLEELAGKRFKESDITFEGTRLILPEKMAPKDAVKTLAAYIEAQEAENQFHRRFRYRPWDGAAAFERAVRKLTGMAGLALASFWEGPPSNISIQVGPNETLNVPWGNISIALFEGIVSLGSYRDPELGLLFSLTITAPKKYEAAIEGFFKLIEEELATGSIYRGKAFDGQQQAEFLDLSGVDPSKVIYSGDVRTQLHANVWALIEHTQAMKDHGMPLKRSVLLHGDYGTGKTLAAFLTARLSVENGWTFIYCRPGKDNLDEVMATARLYQPAVVFFEDIDAVSEGTDQDSTSVTRLLDVFDGISAKGTQIIAILTTNHPDRIHKGMVRPGRLDAVIEFGSLDTAGVQQMVESVIQADRLSSDMDYEAISESMEGFLPAFVRESIDRTVRYSIARTGGSVSELCTEDFVAAARGLRPQLDMMTGAKEGKNRPSLDAAMSDVVRGILNNTLVLDQAHDVANPIVDKASV
jgi:ATPase family protein associated with various cellular activities (AAA)